jgi:hypothetical protein
LELDLCQKLRELQAQNYQIKLCSTKPKNQSFIKKMMYFKAMEKLLLISWQSLALLSLDALQELFIVQILE